MNILDQIINDKEIELDDIKPNLEIFKKIFSKKDANIIGEIKLASPKFDYSSKINLEEVFKFYGNNNLIKAVSILIDKKYFSGDINRGYNFKRAYKKPIFFKEFVINERQIDGASYFGYDSILLLKRVLNFEKLKFFIKYSIGKSIFPIVEIDNELDLKEILELNLDFGIAVNCRNLSTMEIDRNRHFKIYDDFKKYFGNRMIFAFSGMDDLEQVKEYIGKYNGVLIGTSFMKRFI